MAASELWARKSILHELRGYNISKVRKLRAHRFLEVLPLVECCGAGRRAVRRDFGLRGLSYVA